MGDSGMHSSKSKLAALLNSQENLCEESLLLLINYDDLIKKGISEGINFQKIFYFNSKKIHKLLYELGEIIKVNSASKSEDVSLYFYLVSSIQEAPHIINYTYDFDFIKKILMTPEKNNGLNDLNQIIKAKIILVLIDNFKGFYEGTIEEIDEIVKVYEEILSNENNIDYLKEISENITEDFIKRESIDLIYAEIITSLIKKDKLSNFEYAFDIMSKMEMRNIDINELIFKKLEHILNSEEDYINKYEIKSIEDLHKFEKINFHYILLKIIVKNSLYIYQIEFLRKTHYNVMKILKKNNKLTFNKINDEEKERIKFVLRKYSDSKYYHFSIVNKVNNKSVSENNNNDDSQKKDNKNNPKEVVDSNGITNLSYYSSNIDRLDSFKKDLKYNILEITKVIGKHECFTEEIKELKNGYFISFGTDEKLLLYNKNFEKIDEKKVGEPIKNIIEITSNEINIKMILSTYQKLYLVEINLKDETFWRIKNFDYGGLVCLGTKKNNYIICNEKGAIIFYDLFINFILPTKKPFSLPNKIFTGGYVLSKNLVAISSNNLLSDEKNILIFYNPESNKIIKEIKNNEEYSFIWSTNGFLLIENEKNDATLKKIFLVASKKNLKTQKNGILTIISSFDEINSNEMSEKFHPTDNFKVYCFCQLFINKNENKVITKDLVKTDFFLVGGFDQEKRCGLIKLYKAKFGINEKETNIDFVQDIEFEETENFYSFNGAISSIIQSKNKGNVLITCYDGNVYLLTIPNLEFYMSEDKM